MIRLEELVSKTPVRAVYGSTDCAVAGISADSRRVARGDLFVALPGTRTDGARFVSEALSRGASAVVSQEKIEGLEVTNLVVQDARQALADMAGVYFGKPSSEMRVAGVTGTNGKTTTAFLLQHICDTALLRCGLLGTIHYQIGDEIVPATRTTPDALELQRLLASMRDAGCKSVVMEVSSHAIVQKRVAGVEFDAAVFTNLTQDHLDYHGTMEAYFEAKASFLEGLELQRFKVGTALVNIDDRYGAQLFDRLQHAGVKSFSFGLGARADFRASSCRTDVNGSSFQLDATGRSWLVRLPLTGMFNIYNALGALSAAHAMGIDVRSAVLALASAPPVPGRLQPVPGKRAFKVFVDYAHTDDALTKALKTLRDLQPSRIITVFGCGGDRDQKKRSLMGAASEALSDWTIVTSDNPRSETPETIAGEIVSGMRRQTHEIILDRKEAIQKAIQMAQPKDIVLIAGKGHEKEQEIAGKRYPFDDVAVAASALEDLSSEFGR